MARDDGGYWLPIHSGLLRDERFAEMTPALRGAWITLYLLLDGEPRSGWFRDRARIVWLLSRDGWSSDDANEAVNSLDTGGWLVVEGEDSPALTLRGWLKYTGQTARKAIYNQERGDRGDRSAEYARRKEARKSETVRREPTGDRGRPRRDETTLDVLSPSPAHGRGAGGKSMKQAMEDLGFDPASIGAKRVAKPKAADVLTDMPEVF